MKVLFLTKYDKLAANTRYRCLQFIPFLEKRGIECFVSPLLGDDYLKHKFASGKFKWTSVVRAYWSRVLKLKEIPNFDAVVLHYEFLPYFPPVFERFCSWWFGVPFIYDFDDAIFHQYEAHRRFWVRFCFGNKIRAVVKVCKTVLAGNSYLAEFAKPYCRNIYIVPTVVDHSRYQVTVENSRQPVVDEPFTIGWIGSPSTSTYVRQKSEALREFCSKHNAQLILVGSGPMDLPGVPVVVKEWSESTQFLELRKFDVGIMPLQDDVWTRGKCGFKLIQYMASGVPVIASPVGVNRSLVEQGVSGYLATTDREWIESLETLYNDRRKRHEMGLAGKKKVQKEFSLAIYAPIVSEIIRSTVKRKKVLHLISSLSAGGTEMMLFKLLSGMDRDEFENVVISMTDGGDEMVGNRIRGIGIPVFSLKMRSGVPNILGAFRLIRILLTEKPDILQTWLYHSDLLGALVAKISGVKTLIWNIRCSYLDLKQYSKITTLSVKLLAKGSKIPDLVLVNSTAGLNYHKGLGYKPRTWRLIANGFDVQQFRPNFEYNIEERKKYNIPLDAPVVGMVARFDPMKDHRTFLLAAQHLLRKIPSVHFVLVGRGVSPANPLIADLVQEIGFREQFHLLGEQKDVPRILSMLDIFTLASLGEGFPNVIGEAMACGVPCVVTGVGDADYIVGDCGLVVPVGDASAMSEAWHKVLSLPKEQRQRLSNQSRERIVELFNLPVIVSQYENIYRTLADEKKEQRKRAYRAKSANEVLTTTSSV